MSDFNVDINTARIEVNKLDEFWNVFDLTNLIKKKTEPMKLELVTIINLLRHFFNSCCTRLKPKIIYYRNYKNLNEELFLKDLEN